VIFDFLDVGDGEFESVAFAHIGAACEHVVVLLAPSALVQCREPDDRLRREIEAALDSGCHVVPLVAGGFEFASREIAGHNANS
jgi:hypothetical protein